MLPLLGVQLGVQLVAASGACLPAEAPPAATPAVAQRFEARRRPGGWAPPGKVRPKDFEDEGALPKSRPLFFYTLAKVKVLRD